MRIRVLGAGYYGCHVALELLREGHDVEVHDIADRVFAGASGGIPARLHQGFHYPRSRMTRAACQEHSDAFMERYGFLTRGVPVNLYAVAAAESLVDFDQYVRTLEGEVPFIPVADPAEFGLINVEGAVLTGERHILTNASARFFEALLAGCLRLGSDGGDPAAFDWTVDCTFGARDAAGVDRYEPCMVLLLKGPTDRAVTIMDGPFASLYPWDEELGLCSLSSARWTPFSKACRTYGEARELLDEIENETVMTHYRGMLDSMASFYPPVLDFKVVDMRFSVRGMPKSSADTRLVDIAQVDDRSLRVRAGKIDAVIHAGREIIRRITA